MGLKSIYQTQQGVHLPAAFVGQAACREPKPFSKLHGRQPHAEWPWSLCLSLWLSVATDSLEVAPQNLSSHPFTLLECWPADHDVGLGENLLLSALLLPLTGVEEEWQAQKLHCSAAWDFLVKKGKAKQQEHRAREIEENGKMKEAVTMLDLKEQISQHLVIQSRPWLMITNHIKEQGVCKGYHNKYHQDLFLLMADMTH